MSQACATLNKIEQVELQGVWVISLFDIRILKCDNDENTHKTLYCETTFVCGTEVDLKFFKS